MAAQKRRKMLGSASVLVVGGCGFLGHHIVSHLLDSYDVRVSVLDIRTTRNRFPKVQYYDGDITSVTDVNFVLEQVEPSIIIHTASPPLVTDVDKPAVHAMYRKVNIEGTRNLVECAGRSGYVKGFVYTSSASVIHDTESDLIHANESWPVLRSPIQKEYYAETKGIAEEAVLAANRKYGDMLTLAVRPAGIFGEGDVQMIPRMLRAYNERQTGFQLGNNNNLFDFTYVGNVAEAHILAAVALLTTHANTIEFQEHQKVDGEAFLITNDEPVYFWDLPRTVWKLAGEKKEPQDVWVIQKDIGNLIATLMEWVFFVVFWGKKKPNLTRQIVHFSAMTRYYCIDKAKIRLGYSPTVGLQEGLERTVKWHMQEVEKQSL